MISFLLPYLGAIKIGAVVLALLGSCWFGYHYRGLQYEAEMTAAIAEAAKKQKALDASSIEAAVADARNQKAVADKTQKLLDEVRRNGPKNLACTSLDPDWIRLYDANLRFGAPAPDPVKPDAAAKAADPNRVLENAITNFGICNANSQQLIDLQELIRKQGATYQ